MRNGTPPPRVQTQRQWAAHPEAGVSRCRGSGSGQLDKANAADWVEAALANGVHGVATVVFHSIVWQYLASEDCARIERAMAQAGQAAAVDQPLAWLRFEPGRDSAEVRLRLWPGGKDRLLARSGFHGTPVLWLISED
jgi:hypothetical protein